MNALQKLKELTSTGEYLFHGSRFKVDVLVPRVPKNTSDNAPQIKGVYATDEPLIAAFNAILDEKKLPKVNGIRKMTYSWYKAPDRWKFGVSKNVKDNDAFSLGYVYVLDKQPFEKLDLDGEFVATTKIKPTIIIEIDPSEFISEADIVHLPLSYLTESNRHTNSELHAMGY